MQAHASHAASRISGGDLSRDESRGAGGADLPMSAQKPVQVELQIFGQAEQAGDNVVRQIDSCNQRLKGVSPKL